MSCVICQHPKIEAINLSLAGGVAPGIIIRRYRLAPLDFGVHLAHQRAPAQASMTTNDPQSLPGLLIPVTADPLRRVRHHVEEAARIWWDEVDEGRRSPERLQLILAEAFADPNLGL